MSTFELEWQNLYTGSGSLGVLSHLGHSTPRVPSAPSDIQAVLDKASEGAAITRDEALLLVGMSPEHLPHLLLAASKLREMAKGRTLTFSKNVFVPLTQLCRNHCGYCTFKYEPGEGALFMTPEQVVDSARNGAKLGCT